MVAKDHIQSPPDETQVTLKKFQRQTSFLLWQRVVLFFAAYLACAEASAHLSPSASKSASLWLPAGLYVAILLLNRTRDWPYFLLAAFPANFLYDLHHGTTFDAILFFYGANTIQALTGAWLMRRLIAERPSLATLKEFAGFLGFAVVLSTALGAAIGAGTLVHFGFSQSFEQSWKVWWGSCALADLLVAPFILTWFSSSGGIAGFQFPPRRIIEAALSFLGLAIFEWYLLAGESGIMSQYRAWVIPFMLWAGLRLGPRGATAAGLFLSLPIAFFTTQFHCGLTPAQAASGEYVFIMQMVLALVSLVAMVPAIVLTERDRTMAQLRESEERFRNLARAAFEGVCVSEEGRILDVNDQFAALFGYPREELIGREIPTLIAPEWRERIAERLRTGEEGLIEHHLLRKDGTILEAEAQSKTIAWGRRKVRVTAVRNITEQKQAERALRESEEKFSKAFRASPDGLAISELETGRYLEVNDGYCRLYGYRREEMLNHTSLELGIWENPEDRARFVVQLKAAGMARDVEVRTRTRQGGLKIILLSAEAIEVAGKSCFLSVLHDVTDRIQAERALRESEEKFSKAFRTSPDVMSITDYESNCYLEVNVAHEKTFGFKREEVIGRSPGELGIFQNPPVHGKLHRELKERGEAHNVEIEARTRDGRTLTLLHSAELIELGGRLCVLRVSHDITDRKRAEAEKEQAIAREQQARLEYTLQLIASQEAERKRIAAELHDSLGQNLMLIKNLAQMVLHNRKPDETYDQVASINHLAGQCITEARQISHDLHPYQLEHLGLTRALAALVESTESASGIAFAKKFDAVDDVFSRDAATNLYRIVQEGLNNILKYSRAKKARVTLERDLHEVQLRIEDDGGGFKTDKASKGMGLKNIAERTRILGGRLKLDSAPGKGTRFEITIPISAGPE